MSCKKEFDKACKKDCDKGCESKKCCTPKTDAPKKGCGCGC